MASVLSFDVCVAANCKSFTVEEETGVYSATNLGGYGAPNILTTDVLTATIAVTEYGDDSPLAAATSVYSTLPNTSGTTVSITNVNLGFASTAVIPDNVYQVLYTITGTLAITAASVGSKTFTISGDRSGAFIVGETFVVSGGATNAGTYTVAAISYSAPNTTITTVEAPLSATITSNVANFTKYVSSYQLFTCTAEACVNTKLRDVNVTECEDCYSAKLNLIKKIDTFLEAAREAASCSKPAKAQVILSYVNSLCDLSDCSDC